MDRVLGHLGNEPPFKKFNTIEAKDLAIFTIVDDVKEAVDLVSKCYSSECWLGPPVPPQPPAPPVPPVAVFDVSADWSRLI